MSKMTPLLIAALALSACATSPLDDPHVSNAWALDVCAEMDRDQQPACMRRGRLMQAPLVPGETPEQRIDRITLAICGPEGNNDWDDDWGPSCERFGWSGRRYVAHAEQGER